MIFNLLFCKHFFRGRKQFGARFLTDQPLFPFYGKVSGYLKHFEVKSPNHMLKKIDIKLKSLVFCCLFLEENAIVGKECFFGFCPLAPGARCRLAGGSDGAAAGPDRRRPRELRQRHVHHHRPGTTVDPFFSRMNWRPYIGHR